MWISNMWEELTHQLCECEELKVFFKHLEPANRNFILQERIVWVKLPVFRFVHGQKKGTKSGRKMERIPFFR